MRTFYECIRMHMKLIHAKRHAAVILMSGLMINGLMITGIFSDLTLNTMDTLGDLMKKAIPHFHVSSKIQFRAKLRVEFTYEMDGHDEFIITRPNLEELLFEHQGKTLAFETAKLGTSEEMSWTRSLDSSKEYAITLLNNKDDPQSWSLLEIADGPQILWRAQ